MNVSGKPVKESDYRQVLDYMLGEREGMPRGFKFLLGRLTKDPAVKKFMNESKATTDASSSGTGSKSGTGATTNSSYSSQSGQGKRRRRRVHIVANAPAKIIKAAKTRGLIRNNNNNNNNKFRPTLWAKLEA
jgi:single-stranded DNA-binding protein